MVVVEVGVGPRSDHRGLGIPYFSFRFIYLFIHRFTTIHPVSPSWREDGMGCEWHPSTQHYISISGYIRAYPAITAVARGQAAGRSSITLLLRMRE